MQTLREVYRHTFPRRLRYDKASQLLYAQCYSIAKQYRHKKYVPQRALQQVLDSYKPMPGAPWLQLPVIRHLLCIRLLNGLRVYRGRQSWLYNRNVEEEYQTIRDWLDKAAKTPGVGRRSSTLCRSSSTTNSGGSSGRISAGGAAKASSGTASKLEGMVERERFEREVLLNFHVASMYQRMMRLGFCLVGFLCFLLYASLHTDRFVYWYLRYYHRYDKAHILAYFRDITALHTIAEVPPAYACMLPPPCVKRSDTKASAADATAAAERPMDGENATYVVNMVEFTLPGKDIAVFTLPCPQMGEKAFFEQVGRVAMACDAVLMEGVTFDKVDKLTPASFLPLKENTFPALGVQHRFLDILRGSSAAEPPMLYPGGADVSWRAYLLQALLPFELRCVYNPTELSATKAEARVGWGRLRQMIEDAEGGLVATATASPSAGPLSAAAAAPDPYVICVPWTMNHIVNLEASLVKYGFKVRHVYPLQWQRENHLGEHFCAYFSIS